MGGHDCGNWLKDRNKGVYQACARKTLRRPILSQRRVLSTEFHACDENYLTELVLCLRNASVCKLEAKTHDTKAEFPPARCGYLLRMSSSYTLSAGSTVTNVKLLNGFAIVPFTQSAILQCQPDIRLPAQFANLTTHIFTEESAGNGAAFG